ncbi:monovalent cation/H+ antiporter subunit D [Bowmanella pacifica]|uniref:Monovalent cation/H+ antiporter subunit D n=1 Tax=Bowmanella pacifica TaxID=502051 RepID=A0A917Z1A0_9ALTE|nr:monovalent cation/H+ antiporter subunit D [Bowmanella pacifica]GGO72369.1 monovalent cation/H+ antiporter subunit D [Bowmanella pacifica]
MSQHLAIIPILLPLFAGLLMLLPPLAGVENIRRRRITSLIVGAVSIFAAANLAVQVQQGPLFYALGNWQAPNGIVLMADPLAAMLVLATCILVFGSTVYACAGEDRQGAYFYPLLQFQLMGINGAFLTADLFNLFVFFEVLLIASYSLLIHGGGKQKTQANVHYVVLNLVGSSLFLFALGALYGTLGTLNMLDMAMRVPTISEGEQVIAKVGGLMLLMVFGLKAAMLPLHFWLPKTYSAASASVAALFAIMTKVGIYSIYRVYTMIFGEHAGPLADMALGWIWPLALLTLIGGAIGVLASPNLRQMAANMVIISVGTLLISFAIRSQEASAAGFYYMIHSTFVTAALFMIADMLGQQRGKALDRFVVARKVKQPVLLGSLFFVASMAVAGLPPFSGFIGKLLILQSAHQATEMIWVWTLILLAGLVCIVALSRAGSTVFWRHTGGNNNDIASLSYWQIGAAGLMLLMSPLMVVFGAVTTEYMQLAALQLHQFSGLFELLGRANP